MDHPEIIAAATAEAQRQGFTMAAIHAIPALQAAVVICIAPGEFPWAVHNFSAVSGALDEGQYFAFSEDAATKLYERVVYRLSLAEHC